MRRSPTSTPTSPLTPMTGAASASLRSRQKDGSSALSSPMSRSARTTRLRPTPRPSPPGSPARPASATAPAAPRLPIRPARRRSSGTTRNNELTQISYPPESANIAPRTVQFFYQADGDVITVTDGPGNIVSRRLSTPTAIASSSATAPATRSSAPTATRTSCCARHAGSSPTRTEPGQGSLRIRSPSVMPTTTKAICASDRRRGRGHRICL